MQAAGKAAFDKWHIFYVDERVVPHTSPHSTHKGAQEAFLNQVGMVGSKESNLFMHQVGWHMGTSPLQSLLLRPSHQGLGEER